jgi:diguanylate cyclase (GGDEF)-like protein
MPTDRPSADPAEEDRVRLEEAEALRRTGALADAIRIGEEVVATADARGDERTAARARTCLANYHRYVPNSLIAIQLLNRAERYYRTTVDPSLARVLTFKGLVLSDLGDHAKALDLYREALGQFDLHREQADPVQEATCLGAIGIACTQLGEFEQAEDAYRRALDTYSRAGNAEGMGFLYNNLAILRVRRIQAAGANDSEGRDALARELFALIDSGLALNARAIHSRHLEALLASTQGDAYRALGRPAEALPMLERSLAAYRALASPRGEADVAADLGATLLALRRVEDARDALQSGLDVALAHELRDHQRRLRKLLADACEQQRDFETALALYKTYHRLERELSDRDTQKKLSQLALRDEIEKALAEARAESARSALLREQNEALQRQTETLDRIAHVDALTGLANRRRFEVAVGALPERLPHNYAIAVLDIDFFKRINDTWSHAMGDAVLRTVGTLLAAHCREGDVVARVGGEEFVLVLAGVDADGAREACERVRRAVEAYAWNALQEGMQVTLSIGLVQGDGTQAVDALLHHADERLYAAKRAGRNRVVATALAA